MLPLTAHDANRIMASTGLTLKEFNDIKRVKRFREFFNRELIHKAVEGKSCARIVYDQDNVIVLQIDDYIAARYFGTSRWCLGYEERLFKYYNDGGTQYFALDFNLNPDDEASLIGFTDFLPETEQENIVVFGNGNHYGGMKYATHMRWYKALAKNEFIKPIEKLA